MDVRILGTLEVTSGAHRIDLGIRQARTVFTVLALSTRRAVRAGQLAEALWPEGPPPRWEATVQSHVSRLRRALEPRRAPRAPSTRIITLGDAYVLQLEDRELDARRFERVAAEARAALAAGDHQQAVARFDAALAEWRGPALCDFPHPDLVATEVARLEELRVLAREERAEAALAAGEHRATVSELEALVAEHPFRERGWELLLLALYRSGRQSDAVRRYQQVRALLADELGIEPGPALRTMELDILRQSPGLSPVAAMGGEMPSGADLALPSWLEAPRDAFVGRGEEMVAIRAAFDASMAGARRLVLVEGEPGMGKSRLMQEAAGMLREAGALVVGGRCVEEPLHVLEPLAEAIERLAVDEGERIERETPGDVAVLAGLVPELSRRVVPFATLDAGVHRYLLFRAVSNLLDGRHRNRPVVVMFDDLHWAAPAMLQVLAHVLRDDERGSLLVLATARDTEPNDDLAGVITDLRRERRLEVVTLHGLGPAEVGVLAGARGWAGEALDLHSMTEGNPFYVEELVRHVAESGGAEGSGGLPDSVRDTIARRVLRLPETTRRLLGVAAVAGGSFRLDAVARAAEIDVDAADDALVPAARAGIVSEHGQPAGSFRFTHALIHAVLRDGLGAARRARVHRRVGQALVALDADSAEAARHLLAAADDGSDVVAGVELALIAAAKAVERYTYDDAVAVLEPAWVALRQRPDADVALVCRVAITLAGTLRRAGEYARRAALLEEAWVRARAAASPELAADVIVEGCAPTVSPQEPWPTRAEEVDAQLEETSTRRVLLTAIVCNARASESGERAHRLAEWAMARVALLEPAQRRGVTEYCLSVISASSPVERVVDLARGSLNDARASGNVFEVIQALSVLRRTELAAGDIAACERTAREYEALVRSVRVPRFIAGAEQRRAMMALLAGRFAEAELHANEAVALQPLPEFFEGLAVQLFALRLEQGRLGEVRSVVESWAAQDARPAWTLGYGMLLAELGEPDRAAEVMGPLRSTGFEEVPRDEQYFLSLCVAASTANHLDDDGAAGSLYELLSPHASRVVVAGEGALCWGSIHRFLGPLAVLLGQTGRAAMHFEAAISIHERLGAKPFLARDRLAYAAMLHATGGDPVRVDELNRTGLALADQLGMRSVVARHSRRTRPRGEPTSGDGGGR